jgi:hypothetical protein
MPGEDDQLEIGCEDLLYARRPSSRRATAERHPVPRAAVDRYWLLRGPE